MLFAERKPGGSRIGQLDVIRVVVVAAFAELTLDRILPAVAPQWERPWLSFAGDLARNFSSILTIAVLGWAILLTFRRRDALPTPARGLFALIGLLFVPLLAWATIGGVPPVVILQIQTSFIFFILACLFAGLRTAGETRTKIALGLLALPFLLRGYASASSSIELLSFGRLDAREFAEAAGEAVALLGGLAAPLLLPPRAAVRRLFGRGTLIATFAVLTAALLFVFWNGQDADSVAGVLGFRLPEEPAGVLFYLAALFGLTWTLFALLPARGGARLLGSGYAIIAVSGYALVRPGPLAGTSLGLLLLVWGGLESESEREPAPEPVDLDAWVANARTVATQMAGEYVMVNDDHRQITRISGQNGALPVVVRVVRESGVDAVEVVVGSPPPDSHPAFEVEERPTAPESATFERRYRLRSFGSGRPAHIQESHRAALEPLGGTTSVWPGYTVRWRRSFSSPAPIDTFPAVAKALGSLI